MVLRNIGLLDFDRLAQSLPPDLLLLEDAWREKVIAEGMLLILCDEASLHFDVTLVLLDEGDMLLDEAGLTHVVLVLALLQVSEVAVKVSLASFLKLALLRLNHELLHGGAGTRVPKARTLLLLNMLLAPSKLLPMTAIFDHQALVV